MQNNQKRTMKNTEQAVIACKGLDKPKKSDHRRSSKITEYLLEKYKVRSY